MNAFGFKSKSILRTVIMRTALGYPWLKNQQCGADPYLNPNAESRLVHLIEKCSIEHNCIRSCDAMNLAHQLKAEMIVSARQSLKLRKCFKLADQLPIEVEPPSRSWLNSFCHRNDLKLVASRDMESSRCLSCERSKIIQYFLKWMPYFNRDPRLIFGADETDMTPGNAFKVITRDNPGFTEALDDVGHLSAMCCYNAVGATVPPMIILNNLANLPSELDDLTINDTDVSWFVSSKKGYMNETIFYIWAMLFCHWLSCYRAAHLPDPIKRAEVLLILDGHGSRRCPEALQLFRFHNVSLIILPAHCTHLLQAFDVVLASSLKVNFRKYLIAEKQYLQKNHAPQSKAACIRVIMVRAFLKAWRSASSPQACARSFEAVGICPACPFRVLESPFVVDMIRVSEEINSISNKMITDLDVIQMLETNRRKNYPEMFKLNYDESFPDIPSLVRWMMTNHQDNGRLLSVPPTLFWPNGMGVFQVCISFAKKVFTPIQPQRLAEMMSKLAQLEGQRAMQMIHENIKEQHSQLEEVLVRETAKRFGFELAQQIAEERVKGLLDIVGHAIEDRVCESIQDILEKAPMESATKASLISNVGQLIECSTREVIRNICK